MKKLLAAIALSLALAPAEAATTWTVPGTHTLVQAQHGARPGDTIALSDGTYSGTAFFTGLAAGRADSGYVRIVGNMASPGSVIVSGTAGMALNAYTSVRGLKCVGGIDIESASAHDSISYCIVDSGVVYIATGSSDEADSLSGLSINNTTCHVGVMSGSQFAVTLSRVVDGSFVKWRVLGANGPGNGAGLGNCRGRYFYGCRRNTFTDCILEVDLWQTSGNEPNGNNLRNRTNNNLFLRDTVWFDQHSKILGHGHVCLLSQSGDAGTEGYQVYNRWYYCDYRGWDDYGFRFQSGCYGGGIFFSTIVGHGSAALTLFGGADGTPLSFSIRGNTIYNDGGYGLWLGAVPGANCFVAGNAIITRAYPSVFTGHNYDLAACGQYVPVNTSVGVDSNYYSAPNSRQMAFYSGGLHTLAEWVAACGNTRSDSHSRFGIFTGGIFKDARRSSYDFRPSAHSPLYPTTAPLAPGGVGAHYGALAKP